MKKYFTLFLVTLLLFSCSHKSFDGKTDMLAFLKNPENGYYHEKEVNGIEMSLMYRPTDLLVEQELTGLSSPNLDSLRMIYNKNMYFKLSISNNGRELLSSVSNDRNSLGKMVNQLAFGMSDRVHVYNQQKDTLPLTDYVSPRLYGKGGSTTMLLVYPKENEYLESQVITIALEDFGLNTGEIKFKMNGDLIINQPVRIFN